MEPADETAALEDVWIAACERPEAEDPAKPCPHPWPTEIEIINI